jgi:hypothetical protein
MNIREIVAALRQRGMRLWTEGGRVIVEPDALTEADVATILANKPGIVAYLESEAADSIVPPASEPPAAVTQTPVEAPPAARRPPQPLILRTCPLRVSSAVMNGVFKVPATPNSRSPLISGCIRAKIEAIEPKARALGWPPELLWNNQFLGFTEGPGRRLGAHRRNHRSDVQSHRDTHRTRHPALPARG